MVACEEQAKVKATKERRNTMVSIGTIYRCPSCQTEVEVINVGLGSKSTLVCCEETMQSVETYDELYEKEAYDTMDFEWN